MPLDVARITDVPASFPVITPPLLTDAIAEFELLHITLDAAEVPADDVMLAVACTELPDRSEFVGTLTDNVVVGAVDPDPPQAAMTHRKRTVNAEECGRMAVSF